MAGTPPKKDNHPYHKEWFNICETDVSKYVKQDRVVINEWMPVNRVGTGAGTFATGVGSVDPTTGQREVGNVSSAVAGVLSFIAPETFQKMKSWARESDLANQLWLQTTDLRRNYSDGFTFNMFKQRLATMRAGGKSGRKYEPDQYPTLQAFDGKFLIKQDGIFKDDGTKLGSAPEKGHVGKKGSAAAVGAAGAAAAAAPIALLSGPAALVIGAGAAAVGAVAGATDPIGGWLEFRQLLINIANEAIQRLQTRGGPEDRPMTEEAIKRLIGTMRLSGTTPTPISEKAAFIIHMRGRGLIK